MGRLGDDTDGRRALTAVASPPRLAGVDAARVLGVVAIVAGHVWTISPAHRPIYAWHVPLFFFLSGWLWQPGRSVATEAYRRSRSLLVPYVTWLVIIGVVVAVRERSLHRGESLGRQLKNMALGGEHFHRPFSSFWFITVLFVVCVAYRALEGRLSAAQLAGLAVVLWLASYPVAHSLARSPWSVAMAVPCLVFVATGYWLRAALPQHPLRPVAGALLFAGSIAVVSLTRVTVVNLKSGQLGTPVAGLALAVAASLGLVLACEVLDHDAVPALLRRAAVALGAAGLAVVLSHATVLYLLRTPLHGSWADFALALVIPWALALVVVRTRFAQMLVGVTRHRPASWPRAPRRLRVALRVTPGRPAVDR